MEDEFVQPGSLGGAEQPIRGPRTVNDPNRDPSDPQYEASFRERLRHVLWPRPEFGSAEIVATIRTMFRADIAHASGQPVPKQRMMTR